jgi:hypothetical protein
LPEEDPQQDLERFLDNFPKNEIFQKTRVMQGILSCGSHAVVVLEDVPSGLDGTLEGGGVHDCPRTKKGICEIFRL